LKCRVVIFMATLFFLCAAFNVLHFFYDSHYPADPVGTYYAKDGDFTERLTIKHDGHYVQDIRVGDRSYHAANTWEMGTDHWPWPCIGLNNALYDQLGQNGDIPGTLQRIGYLNLELHRTPIGQTTICLDGDWDVWLEQQRP